MKIPGVNYDRRVYSYGQEDINRFGRVARAESAAAKDSAAAQGEALMQPIRQKITDTEIDFQNRSAALAQQGFEFEARSNKLAAKRQSKEVLLNQIKGAVNIADAVITPILRQNEANRAAEADGRFIDGISEASRVIADAPRTVNEDGVPQSKSYNASEAYDEAVSVAMEEALVGVPASEARNLRARWASTAARGRAQLGDAMLEWDKEFASDNWYKQYNEYAAQPSDENIAKMEAWLQTGLENGVFNDDIVKHGELSANLGAYKNQYEVDKELLAISVAADPNDEAERGTKLRQRLTDAADLLYLGPNARKTNLNELDRIEGVISRNAVAVAAFGDLRAENRIEIAATAMAAGVLAPDTPLAAKLVTITEQARVMGAGIDGYYTSEADRIKAKDAVDTALMQGFEGIFRQALAVEGVNGDTTQELLAAVKGSTDGSEFNLLNPRKVTENLQAMEKAAEDQIKARKEEYIAFEEVRLQNLATHQILTGTFNGKAPSSKGTIDVSLTLKEVQDNAYTSLLNGDASIKEIHELLISSNAFGDQAAADVLSLANSSSPQAMVEAATQLTDISRATDRNGSRTGAKIAQDIASKLPDSQKSALAYYEMQNMGRHPSSPLTYENMNQGQRDKLEMVMNYEANTSDVVKEQHKASTLRSLGNETQLADTIIDVMEQMGFDSDITDSLRVKKGGHFASLVDEVKTRVAALSGALPSETATILGIKEAVRARGFTDRPVTDSGFGNAEAHMNGGMPSAALTEDFNTWAENGGHTAAIKNGGMIEVYLGTLEDDDGKAVTGVDGQPLKAFGYAHPDGAPYYKNGKPVIWSPDPANYAFNKRAERKERQGQQRLALDQGRAALSRAHATLQTMNQGDGGRNPAQVQAFSQALANLTIPSPWLVADPAQTVAVPLTDAQENVVRRDIDLVFDQVRASFGDNISQEQAEALDFDRALAMDAALWSAAHNSDDMDAFMANVVEPAGRVVDFVTPLVQANDVAASLLANAGNAIVDAVSKEAEKIRWVWTGVQAGGDVVAEEAYPNALKLIENKQPIEVALPPRSDSEPVDLGAYQVVLPPTVDDLSKLDFVDRYMNPEGKPVIDNGDGTVSTHLMMDTEVDGRYFAYPSIIRTKNKGSLRELGGDEAWEYAKASGEYLEFDTSEAARSYAKNGYKNTINVEAPEMPALHRDTVVVMGKRYQIEPTKKPDIKNEEDYANHFFPDWETALPEIDKTEGRGDHDALFGRAASKGSPFHGVKVSEMTIGEVKKFQESGGPYGRYVKKHSPEKAFSTPVGRYQIVGTTLITALQSLANDGIVIPDDQLFDAETQLILAKKIFNLQGAEAWEALKKGYPDWKKNQGQQVATSGR